MTRTLRIAATLVAVAGCVAAAVWWNATAENNRLGPPVARRLATAVHISGFTPHVRYRAQTGSAVVFLGPSTTVFQPALVTGPRMRLWQPDRTTNTDDIEEDVFDGTAGGSDGTRCDMGIRRYRPGPYLPETYDLSADQEDKAKSGALQVLIVEVHCGGK